MSILRIALAQINPVVGDLAGNGERITRKAREAADLGGKVILFPELAMCGYPPEDLILKDHFVEDTEEQLSNLTNTLPEEAVVLVGAPHKLDEGVFNSAVIFHGGREIGTYHKILLPNYGVFDEKRLFVPGDRAAVLDIGPHRLGIHVCEDSWFTGRASTHVYEDIGVHAILNLSSSPYHRGKRHDRNEVLDSLAKHLGAYVCYCNLVGGQDELVFDGGSKVLSPEGDVEALALQFEEDILLFDLPAGKQPKPVEGEKVDVYSIELSPTPEQPESEARISPPLDENKEVYRALQLGLGDYVNKNRFNNIVVAISGGIDSALVAALAVDALGANRVVGVTMPSQYSSTETRSDAEQLAKNLGIEFFTVPIRELYDEYMEQLQPIWKDREPDVTEENLQARIRGNIVMAFSNKFGWLVLTTGNKSELATGYCTLYGDMVGGFAVLKDVPKMLVFELSRWRNEQGDGPVIPPSIIDRPPSAELRPEQKDTDSLPPYEILDQILERYVERDMMPGDIMQEGFEEETVRRVVRLVDLSEYKRRQGAPGVKITPKAFGRDRRLPITNKYGK